MSARIYPGKGLSLSQLIFALSEELKCVAYSPSYVKESWILGERLADSLHRFTLDQVSQFDLGTSATLATIREWRNSFIPINRVPLEILSLISANLPSQKDRHRASFVCRHWRRTFIQCPELWSQLTLSKGEVYLKTFLERAKLTPLDIIVDRKVTLGMMTLLSPLTKQIRSFNFLGTGRADIKRFSEVISGSLPLLHTLTFYFTEQGLTDEPGLEDFESDCPSLPLFANSVNLKALHFHSTSFISPFVFHIIFPNLVSVDLSTAVHGHVSALRLFDFLEGSPMLQIVNLEVLGYISSLQDILQEKAISLPNVEKFTLIVGDSEPGYEMAAHIHCPSAQVTSITLKSSIKTFPEETFPTSVSCDAIVHQYMRSPAEEVTLEIRPGRAPLTYKLTFGSPDPTTVSFGFEDTSKDEFSLSGTLERVPEIFAQAAQTICDYPQLANIKRLHICHSFRLGFVETPWIETEIGQLLSTLGPLDEMTIYHCDLQPYLPLREGVNGGFVSFPSTKKLTLSHATNLFGYKAGIILLAKLQHGRRMPFEHVVIRSREVLEGIEEELKPWVGGVEYYCEQLHGAPDEWGPR